MSEILRRLKDEDILVKLPLSEIERLIKDQIHDAVGVKPPVEIKPSKVSQFDWRLEVEIDMSKIPQQDQDIIMQKLGYAEGELFDNGDRVMEEIFSEVDTFRSGIDGAARDGIIGDCILVHMSAEDYNKVMSK